MEATTYADIANNLSAWMDKVSDDHISLIITRENRAPVVMMSLEDFNAWQETEYLMRSPANADDLLQAVKDIQQHRHLVHHELIEKS